MNDGCGTGIVLIPGGLHLNTGLGGGNPLRPQSPYALGPKHDDPAPPPPPSSSILIGLLKF